MIKARFKASPDDYRPVKWPIKHPYWCTGYNEDHSIIVAYADSAEEIKANWPEAKDIDVFEESCTSYKFTSRFTKPSWFQEATE